MVNFVNHHMDILVISAAAEGNVKAFREIFDFYLPKMRPIALRYARTSMEADDILQESFVKVFHNLKNFKFEGSFEGWVKRIVVNTALTHFKKHDVFYDSESIDDVSETEIGWENIAELEESSPSEILNIINQLPPGYKLVFNLYVLEDYSHKEIAEMIGISEGSSRSQYSKARKMIKKIFSKQHNNQK